TIKKFNFKIKNSSLFRYNFLKIFISKKFKENHG
ncbi:hypothetical protein cco79_09195, partial [Campylobacter coli LMG 23344]